MIDRPSILQMRRQLSALATNMLQLVEIDANVDADLELPLVETDGWDATVIPAVPESECGENAISETAKGEIPKPDLNKLHGFVPRTFQQMQ